LPESITAPSSPPVQNVKVRDIHPGCEMKLIKIKKKPEMNGTIVKVLKEADTPGRWKVEISTTKQIMSIAEENLQKVEVKKKKKREIESLPESIKAPSSPPVQNVKVRDIQPGYQMKLFKLKRKAEMNGTIVKVLRKADTPGRWKVEVSTTKQIMSIAEENLQKVEVKKKKKREIESLPESITAPYSPPVQNAKVRDIHPGYEMKLFKIKKKPKMNGTIVKVMKEADTPGRWKVEISTTKQIISIAEENLRHF
jgi:hypothetical protein